MDTRKRRKLRRERILYIYKEHYCRPFWTAIKQNSDNVQELNQRMSAFTLGVCIADPHGHWYKTFRGACDEVMKEILDDGMEA